jgi:hypothetical protein
VVSRSKNGTDLTDRRARQYFFIPMDEAVFFANLDESTEQCDSLFTDIAKSFRRNLEAVMLTVCVPFHLTAAGVQRSRFQQIHIAERIRADDESEEEANETALAIATDRFSREQQLPETVRHLASQVLESLDENLNQEDFARASAELLRQGTVSVWAAFEVLVQDLVATLLNAKPDVAVGLLTHERTKGLFQLKALPLDTLAAYNFNVSESLGSILLRHRTVDTVPVMKAVFRVLLPEGDKLKELLEQKDLWILNQRRHLLVHRRGIVDADYTEKTGDALAIGTELIISPSDLEHSLTLVAEVGVELINETSRSY